MIILMEPRTYNSGEGRTCEEKSAMEGIEKIYVVAYPYQRAYNAKKKRASQRKKNVEATPHTISQKLEQILRVREILKILSGITEEENFLRDTLLLFRIKTFGTIGALLIGSLYGFIAYADRTFSLLWMFCFIILGGLCCAYTAARATLHNSKWIELDYLY